jgi:hypothetical protein
VADTVVPRLVAAGADLRWIYCLRGAFDPDGVPRPLTLPDDVAALEAAIDRSSARLVVIDPLNAALSSAIDTYKDHDVRRVLAALAALADRSGCTVLIVRHLTKAARGSAILAGGGSIGIAGAARVVLAVYQDPDDPAVRLLAVVKNNLAARVVTLSFRLESVADSAARINWAGESAWTADQLVGLRAAEDRDGGSESEVVAWLGDYLTRDLEGRDRRAVLAAARDAGFPCARTLERAARRLGVVQRVGGFGSAKRSTWALPTNGDSKADGTLRATGAPQLDGVSRLNSHNDLAPSERLNPGNADTGPHMSQMGPGSATTGAVSPLRPFPRVRL